MNLRTSEHYLLQFPVFLWRPKFLSILSEIRVKNRPKLFCPKILCPKFFAVNVTPDGPTDYFEIKKGVLQDDTLAPYLFAIVIDYIMRQTYNGREYLGFQLCRRRSRRLPAVVTDLDFADDLALLTEEIEQAQEILHRLEKEAEMVGLQCQEN